MDFMIGIICIVLAIMLLFRQIDRRRIKPRKHIRQLNSGYLIAETEADLADVITAAEVHATGLDDIHDRDAAERAAEVIAAAVAERLLNEFKAKPGDKIGSRTYRFGAIRVNITYEFQDEGHS